MKGLDLFNIGIVKLSEKSHEFEYDLNDGFFQCFEDSLIEKGNLKAKVTLDKSSTMIRAEFNISGTVELTCDRSLEIYEEVIETSNRLIFKFGEESKELSDEIISISKETVVLNMAQYLYEFIGLALPMKKLHPKFRTEAGLEEDEQDILIYSTDKSTEGEDKKEDDFIDPRWIILNKLKNNN
jgi:uncharacterized protein